MSKIFNENPNVVKEEIEKIKDSLLVCKQKNLSDNFDMLEFLLSVYSEIFNEVDLDANNLFKGNRKLFSRFEDKYVTSAKKYSENFISNRDFHNEFSARVLKKYIKNFPYIIRRDLNLKEDEMLDIMYDFLDDEFGNSNEFRKLVEGGRIFLTDLSDEEDKTEMTGGYTIFNYVTKNSMIAISDNKMIRDIKLMAILMHEFGHVADDLEKSKFRSRKDIINYNFSSSYVEIYSLLYEKLFYDYLINNNIYRDSALYHLGSFFEGIYYNFVELFYATIPENINIDNNKHLKYSFDEDNDVELGVVYGLRNNVSYGYGGVLANYLANIKHENEDRFNTKMIDFNNARFGIFNEDIFDKLGTSTDEVVGYLNKDLKKLSNSRKLILK